MHNLTTWETAPEKPPLIDGELHVWRFALNREDPDTLASARSILNEEERRRADRLVIEPARHRFTLAHATLRRIVALYLPVSMRELDFQYGPHGKPYLAGKPICFNLSHSGAMALVAITKNAEVGIDIEEINRRHAADEIAERFFSEAENLAYRAYQEPERLHAFFRCWSRKEAVIKALGEGLSCPLHSFDVSLDRNHARLLDLRRQDAHAGSWVMFAVDAHPDYTAAAAVIGSCRRVRGFDARNMVA